MKTVLLIDIDLFFRAKIEATLTAAGYAVTTSSDVAADLVLADVNRCDPVLVAATHEGIPMLGFGRHTDAHLLRRAREAGFTRVIARSALAKRLPEVVAALLNPAVPPATSRVERDRTQARTKEASSG